MNNLAFWASCNALWDCLIYDVVYVVSSLGFGTRLSFLSPISALHVALLHIILTRFLLASGSDVVVWKVRGGFDRVLRAGSACHQQKQRSGLQRWIKDVLTEHFHMPDKLSAPHVRRMQMNSHLHPYVKHPVNFSFAVFVNELPRAGTSTHFISSDPECESRLFNCRWREIKHIYTWMTVKGCRCCDALSFLTLIYLESHTQDWRYWAYDLWTNVIYASYLWIFSWEKCKAGQAQDLIGS